MLITRISGAKLLFFFCFSKYSSDFISQRDVPRCVNNFLHYLYVRVGNLFDRIINFAKNELIWRVKFRN